ncbi:SsrA-binding protein [Candidatus Saccharibacteria bacterium]|nr:SsrA-binding protein [Candidatus Saccharibacteria bacterium]
MKKPTRRGHKTASKKSTPMITNRRASFDYELSDNLTVGLELTGAETKAARLGRVQLRGAYVTTRENRDKKRAELFLINASFSLATNASKNSGETTSTVDTRARKILAKRKEIDALVVRKNSGLTIVPTKLLTNGRYVKLVIALGKGKKKYDKRETIRKRDTERENSKFLKRS